MNNVRILVVDFARKPRLIVELQRMLGHCSQPRFQVEYHHCGEVKTPISLQQFVAEGRCPAVLLLIFEQPPVRGNLLEEAVGPTIVGHSSAVVVALRCSAGELLDAVFRGTAEIWGWPLTLEQIQSRLSHLLEPSAQETNPTVERLNERAGLRRFIGQSPALLAAIRHIPRIAARNVKVLIRGE